MFVNRIKHAACTEGKCSVAPRLWFYDAEHISSPPCDTHTHTHTSIGLGQPFLSCNVLKVHCNTEPSKSTHIHKPLLFSFQPHAPLSPVWVPGSASKGPVIHQNDDAPRLPLWWLGEQHRRSKGGKDSYFVSSVHIFLFPLPSSHSLWLSPLLFSCSLSASSRHIRIIWRERRDRGLEGGKGRKGCSFLFLSHCVWRTMPLLISTVGTQRFERWEFKQRLLGRWHLWCSSRVYMFWNVKCTRKYCFQLSLSSLRLSAKWMEYILSITGLYKTEATPLSLESGIIFYQTLETPSTHMLATQVTPICALVDWGY